VVMMVVVVVVVAVVGVKIQTPPCVVPCV